MRIDIYQTSYTFGVETELDVGEARKKVEALLKEEGFGILTEIDVKATLRKKLDLDFRPYLILGACNPKIAHQAFEKDLEIGALLPCNVIIYENESGGSKIAFMDPEAALKLAGNESLTEYAGMVRTKLQKIAEKI